jgi:hypothetical protein
MIPIINNNYSGRSINTYLLSMMAKLRVPTAFVTGYYYADSVAQARLRGSPTLC